MKVILFFLLLCGSVFGADTSKYVFVFLNANPNRTQLGQDSVKTLQKAHLENIDRLYHQGKLSIAGPFADTSGGGIFILNAKSIDEANMLLETDPAIRAGRYTLEIYPCKVRNGSICAASDLFDLAKYPLARLTYQRTVDTDNRALQDRYYDELTHSGKVLFRGVLDSNNSSVVIFAKNDKIDEARQLVKNDPAVRAVEMRQSLRLWWTAPGVFCETAE